MISRCVCHKRTFKELQELARLNNVNTLKIMIERGWCGTNCGLCHMYIEEMLNTGKTEFSLNALKRSNTG